MKRGGWKGVAVGVAVGGAVMVAAAQQAGNRAPFWPAVHKDSLFSEWYSDIPWHQKLGTFAGNEIYVPLILPYDALGDAEKAYCTTNGLSNEACMIEVGVNNILGMRRTDTLYCGKDSKPEDGCVQPDPKILAADECKNADLPCVEVKLELSSFWSRPSGADVALVPRPFGKEPFPAGKVDHYGGYVITDGSTYAPQMPWYMAHYCDSFFPAGKPDVQDPVCYADYFSPMNNGFNPMLTGITGWPASMPWSVYPYAVGSEPPPAPQPPGNHCKDGETRCTLTMAGFKLSPVASNPADLQYAKYNGFLMTWFNGALKNFPTDAGAAENQRHFPWSGSEVTWETFLYPQAIQNPFLGQFPNINGGNASGPNCDTTVNGPNSENCFNTEIRRGSPSLYPRRCSLADLGSGNVERLRQCGLNYELHHNGFYEQWPERLWDEVNRLGMIANQYGRTSFLFAGVPGMQMPVSFARPDQTGASMSVYEQVHNASIFSLYLPYANLNDTKRAYAGRQYTDKEFYHTLLMSNHMESDPVVFAEGIRGKTLWHNEYRTQKMFEAAHEKKSTLFPAHTFAGSFDPASAKAPYHNNTCDSCHVRNGSGIPINTARRLDVALQEFMTDREYSPDPIPDYTFTGKIRPMKLVFFDLGRKTARLDGSRYSEPMPILPAAALRALRPAERDELFYNNKVMNFHGDSFHLNDGNTYSWSYAPVAQDHLVVNVPRVNAELGKTYTLLGIKLGTFTTNAPCVLVEPSPTTKPWPANCDEVDGAAIGAAIGAGEVGYMLLNGKRLGNLSAIEAIPNQAIIGFRANQVSALGQTIAGELIWNAGTRDGVDGQVKRVCRTSSLTDCFIGRFGWIGDRVSLEDQVANAAFVEMNMTSTQGYNALYFHEQVPFPLRYLKPNCGPANKTCVESTGNGDLSEVDVARMAEYARWIGNPTRSELKVMLPEVIAGEKTFRRLQCDTCHVIRKIDVVPEDTMLSKPFRDRLATRVAQSTGPFLSYIGTDLLMHDMGYLSQVADSARPLRDQNGVVLPGMENFVQKIRTPALKGLGMNRFVTDSHRNTKTPTDPACDFLLHDGRACDAIEAAFLHDGPAIKKLRTIEGLNGLSPREVLELRAFLYSL